MAAKQGPNVCSACQIGPSASCWFQWWLLRSAVHRSAPFFRWSLHGTSVQLMRRTPTGAALRRACPAADSGACAARGSPASASARAVGAAPSGTPVEITLAQACQEAPSAAFSTASCSPSGFAAADADAAICRIGLRQGLAKEAAGPHLVLAGLLVAPRHPASADSVPAMCVASEMRLATCARLVGVALWMRPNLPPGSSAGWMLAWFGRRPAFGELYEQAAVRLV
jgi:hypothetical protein